MGLSRDQVGQDTHVTAREQLSGFAANVFSNTRTLVMSSVHLRFMLQFYERFIIVGTTCGCHLARKAGKDSRES
jgi:hypothetical protein